MKDDYTLLILAAGMGSRFGGLKQIEPFGPNGEFIIDYSIYDAIEAGFTKVVFLIKEENYKTFRNTIGKRIESKIKTEYCFQSNDNIPEEYKVPEDRKKPLGTAHAILCCKEKINEPFAMINADDFYGKDAYKKAMEFLQEEHKENTYGLVGYLIKNTISENGSVKRGMCKVENGYLKYIVESSVIKENNHIIATPVDGSHSFEVEEKAINCMNMLLFNQTIFKKLEEEFPKFLNNKDNLESEEFMIPDILEKCIEDNYAKVEVIETNAKWYGVTYKEDTEIVKTAIKKLIINKDYKEHLWN